MLLELMVENYAVVEQARIRFQDGLNVLTGETGSGKSIVVDSLALLLGARASAEMVRSGETRARVSGIFSVAAVPEVNRLLTEAGIESDSEEELIVEREIAANGKSRAFVANRPVTTAFLRQLAPALADIHGQNEQQLLFTTAAERDLLDEYARAGQLREEVAGAYARWRELETKLAELNENEQEKLRLLDLWTFQRKEIDAVQPRSGEDAELEAERKILQNVTRLQENATAAFEMLYEAPESATTQMRQALKRLDDLARIDESLAETAGTLRQASVLIDEAAYALRDYLGRLEGDPNRLEDVENRLAALDRLKRKYGSSLEQVLAFRDDVARRIDEVENASERRAELEKQRAAAAEQFEKLAGELSRMRNAAGARLSKQVESELKSLAMAGTRFQVVVKPGNRTAAGVDDIEFLVAPNRGEELKLMEKIASGGELSRIALALKTAIGDADQHEGIHTLVFDEVDAGVGGAAAAAVGKRLKALSRRNQVICVTHLAQIAGFADHHFAVSKREKKGRVTTAIEELQPEERAREIGRMLSGEQITPEALRQAEQLMEAGRGR
ncbi:MAG TPA: DNA repair protein RecN [Bryobacteraceae bacterium]|jgi:DNA repair protein RecN (Recombination protein N)|nr:DNA repair protein RecN [Bryobacteraceae bacterium]